MSDALKTPGPASATCWHLLDLGDAMLAGERLDPLKRRCHAAFERAGAPAGWAVYQAHVSGDLHCSVHVFFSPAAAELAGKLDAQPCGGPPQGASLLAGDGTGLFD